MPKVTDAYREARRDEIAHAVMRCLLRSGFANTSMADIIAESGLSAGAIYSHFDSKAQIAHHVGKVVIGNRSDELIAYARSRPTPASPGEIVRHLMEQIEHGDVPTSLLLQVWAEATVDPELHELALSAAGQLRDAYESAVRPWLERRGLASSPAAVRDATSAMLTVSQGYIVHSALFHTLTPQKYVATVGTLLG